MFKEVVRKQREFYQTHETLSYNYRLNKLKKLKDSVVYNEQFIKEALYKDLNKSSGEAYVTEISMVLAELNYLIKNLKKLMKPEKVRSPLAVFPAKSYHHYEPLGVVLVISPWNYPFLLSLNPLMGAIASGNTVVLKPSEFSVNTTEVLIKIISEVFNEEEVSVVTGEVKETTELLKENFDYIFFTGSPKVGKIVMKAASEHLTPVTLELGGKSPAIIYPDAKFDLAVKRLVYGKLVNSGQTCIAPDYLMMKEEMLSDFIVQFNKNVELFYGDDPLENDIYPKIITESHHKRLVELFEDEEILAGGKYSLEKIEPTVIIVNDLDSKIMKEEIFGPILPIILYQEEEEIIEYINKNHKPLALYAFTKDKKIKKDLINKTSSGAITFNDTIMHFANHNLNFGGVGNSGMGKYHGKETFYTFTHKKAILDRKTWLDVKLRYFPISERQERLIKKVL